MARASLGTESLMSYESHRAQSRQPDHSKIDPEEWGRPHLVMFRSLPCKGRPDGIPNAIPHAHVTCHGRSVKARTEQRLREGASRYRRGSLSPSETDSQSAPLVEVEDDEPPPVVPALANTVSIRPPAASTDASNAAPMAAG
jgi:hypothetical protein